MSSITSLSGDKKNIRIAINGFGRIGRQFFKNAFEHPNIQIVAVNDLQDINALAYLLKYDTVYGKYNKKVEVKDNHFEVEGKKVLFYSNPNPQELPWGDLDIDFVVESTGFFTTYEKAKAHLQAGAKRVVISAPAKDEETPTATPNNKVDEITASKITSNGSCTTNAATPVTSILEQTLGIECALLNTIHGYTSTQSLVDKPNPKDYRRGRAAAQNLIPTTSGAAISVTKVFPNLAGNMDAMAIRAPVVSGSILDYTFISKKETSVEELNNLFIEYSQKPEWQDILAVTSDPIVSTDILQNPHGAIVDLKMTRVINKKLCKLLVWYDNEWGYVNMLLKHIIQLSSFMNK